MNKFDLKSALDSLNVTPDCYSLDGDRNESLCLESNSQTWSIYYSERGLKTQLESYDNENDACQRFFIRIKNMLRLP